MKPSNHDFLAGGGETGARMRALDWSKTPLGPAQGWPQSLRSAVSTCIGSRFPIVLYWGPQRVVLYNDAYAEILGSKHPWALGRPCQEVWAEIWQVIGPMLDGVAATGQATWSEDQLLLLERRGFPEECYFSFSFSPVRGEDGQVEGIFTAVIENTRQVLGERRLRTLREFTERTLPARSEREACVLAMDSLIDKPDVAFAIAYLGNDLQAATPGAEEAFAGAQREPAKELSIPGGKLVVGVNPRRPYDEQYASFFGLLAGQLATAITNARAYEDEKKRAEALAEVDRAKIAFFSNVSHEFRTPLTLMLAPLEDVLAGSLPPAERERIQVAQRNARRLLKLVNTLLDFSRIEAGRAEGSFQSTDLATLTAELASQFRSAAERAGLRFDVACAPLGEPAWVDREMWEKIVFNLLSNAFKFTFEGGIWVSLRREGAHAVLSVRDTGTGIPAAEQAHVFERFHRVRDARGRSLEGSGIGLSLVQELVRLHVGGVSVQSEPGHGSEFRVAIPLGRAHLPAARVGAPAQAAQRAGLRGAAYVDEILGWLPQATQQPAAAPAGAGARRARVLLADDNADMRAYVQRLLGADYEVHAAADGEAALQAARTSENDPPFDIVLTDVMMPRLDGFGLIAALRADERTRGMPVIMLSARAGEEARVEGMAAGADDYMVKPFSAKELQARVAARLEIARIRREAGAATQQLIAQLQESDRRKDEFLATLSHELRNPLAPLANSLHLLRAGSDQRSAGIHEMMERQVNHLVRLVDDLLEMSRISRGAFDLRKERVGVAEIVRNAVETSQPLVQAARHALELDVPAQPLWVTGDPVRLAQILANLLNNAARYTDPGGRIAISARRADGTVRISVRDNGSGIAPEALPRLFEMFTRGDPQSTRNQGGLGIGLALSRRLAEMHQGSIEAKSEGVGKGAEFIVTLPLAADQASAGAQRESAAAPLTPRRILVVDDNRDAADSLSMVLKFLGADVRVARDGPEALQAFEAYDPAVVLLDIGMPGMDGYEVARRIRTRDPQHRAALVALTGWGQDRDRQLAREAGFDRHLIKPAEIGALQALLSSL